MKIENTKIKDIEKMEQIEFSINNHGTSLDKWYVKLREKRLFELSYGDIAILIRQKLYIKYIVPLAINLLNQNPIAGELYAGEILLALEQLGENFWEENADLYSEIVVLLDRINRGLIVIDDGEWVSEHEKEKFREIVLSFYFKIIGSYNSKENSDG